MAKKAAAAAAPAEPAPEPVGLSEAIRQGISSLGNDVKTSDLKEWILENHKALEAKVNSNTFSSTLSGIRKSLGIGSSRGSTNNTSSTNNDELTIKELIHIKGKLDEKGLDKVMEAIALVKELGDTQRIERAIEYLQRLGKN